MRFNAGIIERPNISISPHDTDRRLRSDAAANRRRVLQAARELFVERGIDVGLKDIADRAGIGVGTVYRRFPDKDSLLDALFQESLDRLEEKYREALASPDPWLGFESYLERTFEMLSTERGFWFLATRGSTKYRNLETGRELFWKHVPTLIARAAQSGNLRSDLTPGDVLVIQVALTAAIDFDSEDGFSAARRLLEIIFDGLRRQRRAPHPLTGRALTTEESARAMELWLHKSSGPRTASRNGPSDRS
jgi:AcrR family transcriptional regulator